MRRSPVKITYTDGYRLCSALEIRTHGSSEYPELILISRLHSYYRIRSEHERPDIKRSSRTIWRNIFLVCLHGLTHRIKESFFRENRHLKPLGGCHHPLRIKVRPEAYRLSVLCRIRLKSLKNGLGILEDAGTLAERYRVILRYTPDIPLSVLIIRYVSFIRLYIAESKISPVDILLNHINTSNNCINFYSKREKHTCFCSFAAPNLGRFIGIFLTKFGRIPRRYPVRTTKIICRSSRMPRLSA